MKKLRIILGLFLLVVANTIWAQSNYTGHVTLLRKNATMISAGIGSLTPGTDGKDLGFGNTINLNLGIYQSLWQKNNAGFGLHAFGEYSFGNGSIKNFAAFPIAGYTSSVENPANPKFSGFSVGAGPQVNFGLGDKVMISPIVDFAYVNQKLDAYSVMQNYNSGGTSKSISLYSQPEIKTSGLGIIPRIRFQYFFSKNIGVWLEGNYAVLPKINTTTSTFTPNGNPVQNGQYNIDQIVSGIQNPKEIAVNNSGIGFGGGIVISLGKANHTEGIKNESNGKTEETKPMQIEEEKLPANIQTLIDQQDAKMNVTFQKVKNKNMKVSSLCNFNVEKVELECNGRDNQGNKKYKVKISYKNLATSGIGSLGHYTSACTATTTNGNYIDVGPSGSAVITNLSPSTSVKTMVPPLSTQIITFDFVPLSGFSTLNIMGNLINSATNCGNCDDIITLNLPNCCDGCEENPVTAVNNSIVSMNDNNGTISIKNTVSSPRNIVKIEADLVSVKIVPNNNDCLKCNNVIKKQDHFVDKNQIINNTGWASSGNPSKYGGENTDTTVSRSLTYTSTAATGINLSSGAQFNHTVGIAPASCCGDTVEIWIRYTVWDKDCHVCDKLVKSTIKRAPSCNSNGTGTGTTGGTSSSPNIPTKINF